MGFRSGLSSGEEEWAMKDISFKAGMSKGGYEDTLVMTQERRSVGRGSIESGDRPSLIAET